MKRNADICTMSQYGSAGSIFDYPSEYDLSSPRRLRSTRQRRISSELEEIFDFPALPAVQQKSQKRNKSRLVDIVPPQSGQQMKTSSRDSGNETNATIVQPSSSPAVSARSVSPAVIESTAAPEDDVINNLEVEPPSPNVYNSNQEKVQQCLNKPVVTYGRKKGSNSSVGGSLDATNYEKFNVEGFMNWLVPRAASACSASQFLLVDILKKDSIFLCLLNSLHQIQSNAYLMERKNLDELFLLVLAQSNLRGIIEGELNEINKTYHGVLGILQ